LTCLKERNNLEINSYYFYRENKDNYREEAYVPTSIKIRKVKVRGQ